MQGPGGCHPSASCSSWGGSALGTGGRGGGARGAGVPRELCRAAGKRTHGGDIRPCLARNPHPRGSGRFSCTLLGRFLGRHKPGNLQTPLCWQELQRASRAAAREPPGHPSVRGCRQPQFGPWLLLHSPSMAVPSSGAAHSQLSLPLTHCSELGGGAQAVLPAQPWQLRTEPLWGPVLAPRTWSSAVLLLSYPPSLGAAPHSPAKDRPSRAGSQHPPTLANPLVVLVEN